VEKIIFLENNKTENSVSEGSADYGKCFEKLIQSKKIE